MATANSNFRIAELDFDTIKTNLRNYLQAQTQFQDYDFTGSGLNILLDLLSYNTHYMAYYLNMVGNEMFLDSAVIRDSIISRAKHMNYVPTSSRGAVANVTLIITPPDDDPTTVIAIPAYTVFQSEALFGNNYTFVTPGTITVTKNLTSNTFQTMTDLIQGEHFTYTFLVDPTIVNSTFAIPDPKIDITTLGVVVQNSDADTYQTTYTQALDLTRVTSESANYFLELSHNDQYAIYFGDGNIGRPISNNNLVIVDYISSKGSAPNGVKQFTAQSPIASYSNVQVITNSASVGGKEIEDSESIRLHAPIYYTEQNRAVTLPDYSIILKDFPYVNQVVAWGGEENIPPVYGKVFISLQPKNGYAITEAQKKAIINDLVTNYSTVTVIPEIIDPDYLYVIIICTVYYDPKNTSLTSTDIASLTRTTIINHANTHFDGFNASLRESKLHADIDNSEQSILNNDLSVQIQKRFIPTANASLNYTINFGVPIHRGGPADKLFTFPAFKYADSTGTLFDSFIEEVPFSFTGIDSIEITNPGSNYVTPPDVTITGDGTGATAVCTIENGKIIQILMVTRGVNYSSAQISFSGGGGEGAAAIPNLSEQFGQLQIVYYKTDGSKIVLNSDIGTTDYLNGIIQLFNFNPVTVAVNSKYPEGVLTINAESDQQTIIPSRNVIMVLDPNDPSSIQVATSQTGPIRALPF